MERVQYLDVNSIVQAFPVGADPIHQPNIEVTACLMCKDSIESGATKKLRANIGVYNIPEGYYVEFVGLKTSASIWTKEGVLKHDSYGYLHVYIHNSALETRILPAGLKLGHLTIKRYLNLTENDFVDEIYMHNGLKHACNDACSQFYSGS